MARFSERNGYVPRKSIIQIDDLDESTRTRLWNILQVVAIRPFDEKSLYREEGGFLDYLWIHFLEVAVDERSSHSWKAWPIIKGNLIGADFSRTMDLLEIFLAGFEVFTKQTGMSKAPDHLVELINETFESNLVGYRFVNGQLLQIDSKEEVVAIEEALSTASTLGVAQEHLNQALAHLVDRNNPDYRNVIKESIQAVESSVVTLTQKTKFSDAVRALPSVGLPSHRALLGSWEKMYGWASDEDGLRHGGESIAEVDQALAKYVFGTSATFVAYLVEKARQAGALPGQS